jgi:shikimate kinase
MPSAHFHYPVINPKAVPFSPAGVCDSSLLYSSFNHLRPMLVYLIGFMGCGKSTHGKKLAGLLRFHFIDMDIALQQLNPVNTLLSNKQGEQTFRLMEHEWLISNAAKLHHTVIATGGGAPCFFNNMELMNRSGITVYINMHPASLFHRLAPAKTGRPLIASLPDTELMDFIHSKLLERDQFYRQAHLTVKGENLNVKALAEQIKSHPLFADKQ